MGSGSRLRLSVLGPVRAWRDGVRLPLGPVRQQAVLAALALRPGLLVSREQLLDAVWGDRPPQSGHKVLPSHVYGLRKSLDETGAGPAESLIRGERGGYRFVRDGVRLDVADLADRVESARRMKAADDTAGAAGQLLEALGLFDGEPLAGLPGPYAEAERQRLLQRLRTVRIERIDCLVLLGRHAEALEELVAPSASDPYDESLLALRMRALYGSERQAEALTAYEEMRSRLRDELGVDPGEELRRVYESVLRQDGVAPAGSAPPPSAHATDAAPSPAELPHITRGFAGRFDELAHLDGLLTPTRAQGQANTVVISAIGGAAGIGKTALAVHWAHQVRDRFPDGQLYVNLHGFDHERPPLTPGEVLELLLRSLGFEASQIPADGEAQARAYRTLTDGRRLLVLLDNAASAEQVRPLLPGSPSCCVVVTSRNRLGDLVARDGARALALDVLLPDEARALLVEALGADRLTAQPDAADELIRLCGGLPLALRVAAARLAGDPGFGVADLVGEMSEGSRLEALALDEDANSPLRVAFSVSYGFLAPEAQRLFRLLGLFPGPEFTAPVAAALLDIEPTQARRLLGALAAAHLIDHGATGRYRFHDLLREYARECARAEEAEADREAALKRVLIWYVHATRAAAGTWFFPELPDSLDGGEQRGLPTAAEARAWLEAERANLLAVINHASLHGPHAVAGYLVSSLLGYFWLHLSRATWRSLAQTALEATMAADDLHTQAVMHSILGITQWDQGQPRRAAEHCTRVLEIGRELHWPAAEAMALGVSGYVDWSTARLDRAYERLTAGLRITDEIGNRYFEAFGLLGLGMTARDLGRLHEAAGHLELVISRNAKVSWWDDSLALQVLGGVYWELGRLADGLYVLGPKVTADDGGGYRSGRAMMLDAAAKIKVELGRHEEALALTERACDMFGDPERPWIHSGILNTVASAHRSLSRFDTSLQADQEALALARTSRSRRAEADSLLGLALTHERLGRPEDARRPADEALRLARAYGFRVVEGQALTVLSAVALSESAYAKAVTLGEASLTAHRETGHRLGEARALTVLARALGPSDGAAADRLRQQASAIYSGAGIPAEVYEGGLGHST
ncbi:AfsR/SARP family transcriptional regulator [Streptomyces sp. NBC_01465]|uniref:AfsR/SARP family transcriptional regulator n=1 Tax=Streptomyces sp. NBC_01465 TaxID=2903878 RepID=UPI002E362122|nr:BTAD domain-containing putative transcriptional regulator [Streptomyces sp. NBC_01465]